MQKVIVLNATGQTVGNRQRSITINWQRHPSSSAQSATRLSSQMTICTCSHRQTVQHAILQLHGNRQPITMTGISGLTVITRQGALPAIPIRVIIKNTPATTAMNIHSRVWFISMKKKEYSTSRTAWYAIAMEARKEGKERDEAGMTISIWKNDILIAGLLNA